jgi:transcriptional regulator with XRE-family HTH domain
MSARSHTTVQRGVVSGYLLKLVRESIPRSQEEMARELTVDRGTVQGWETGRRPFVAVPLAQTVALRHRYTALGATTSLVDALDVAVEADFLISQIIDTAPEDVDLNRHPLGWTVMTHTLVEMLAWPMTGRMPEVVRKTARVASRRGPVASAPVLTAAARESFFTNLFVLADRAVQPDGPIALLRRQATFLLGFDATDRATTRVARSMKPDYFSRTCGWSPSWPVARSVAASLARLGDVDPLRAFIAHAHPDGTCELAGLNYWAYWVGEIAGGQRSDQFMLGTHRWRGDRMLAHIVRRLDRSNGFRDLYVHTLRALLIARPELLRDDPSSAEELYARGERLLDEADLSIQSRQELAAILSVIRAEGLIR